MPNLFKSNVRFIYREVTEINHLSPQTIPGGNSSSLAITVQNPMPQVNRPGRSRKTRLATKERTEQRKK